jgi:hypothetical protein
LHRRRRQRPEGVGGGGVGRVEGLEDEFGQGDVAGRAEGSQGVQEAELGPGVPQPQRDEDLIASRLGLATAVATATDTVVATRTADADAGILADLARQADEEGIIANGNLPAQPADQVGAPFRQVDDLRCQAMGVQSSSCGLAFALPVSRQLRWRVETPVLDASSSWDSRRRSRQARSVWPAAVRLVLAMTRTLAGRLRRGP